MEQVNQTQKEDPIQDGLGFNSPKLPKSNKKNVPINKQNSSAIPKEIANRMARRVAIATGIPTISGMGVFIGSYILVTRGIAEISPTLTLVSSATCFLIGLLGLSYGILSASWDQSKGSFLGIENIKTNISRVRSAFQNSNKKN